MDPKYETSSYSLNAMMLTYEIEQANKCNNYLGLAYQL